MKTNLLLSLFILIACTGLLLAATSTTTGGSSTGPLIQISSYSTVPSTVYAGTTGYLQVSIANNGGATASSATAVSSLDGVQNSVTIGDLAPGSSSVVVVPFHIDPSSAGGIQVIGVVINYFDQSSGSATTSKTASLYVPLQVAQTSPLVVDTSPMGSSTVAAGEPVQLVLTLHNKGGIINNLAITAPANSSFTLDGTSQVLAGTIPSNSSQNITLTLLSSTSTPVGTYAIPLLFTYYDRLNNPTVETLSVGPVNVQDASSKFRLQITSPAVVEIGSQAVLHLTLSNTGSQPISARVDVNSTDVLTPVGLERIYFDSVLPGQSATQDLTLGVSATAASGYYTLPITLTPSVGGSTVQYAGIAVEATPALTISLDRSGTTPNILIANTGNSQIRSVHAIITNPSTPQIAGVQNFVGTLNVDDYATVPLDNSLSGTVQVEVTFKDSQNAPHTVTQTIDLSSGGAALYAGAGSGRASNFTGGARGGVLGGLFGGRPSSANGSGGLPIIPIAIGIVVIAIIAFYLYRRSRQKAAAAKAASHEALKAVLRDAGKTGKGSK